MKSYMTLEAFKERHQEHSLPRKKNGEVDETPILQAIFDAEILIEEAIKGIEPLPSCELLKLCAGDIAFYRLNDRASFNEDTKERYQAAMSILQSLSKSKLSQAVIQVKKRRTFPF